MKLFIRVLLFVFVALITKVEIVSASITFFNIQETTTSLSFYGKIQKKVVRVVENDLANCCKNEWELVDYSNGGKGVEAVAAKWGHQ